MSSDRDFSEYRKTYQEDGVVILRGAIDAATMALVNEAYAWSKERRTPALQDFSASSDEQFVADTGYSVREPIYNALLRDTDIPDIASALFGEESPVWYLGEQIFFKQGPSGSRRTPWHQDTSYADFDGPKMAVFWIPLDDIPREGSLEVVRGSHRRVTYNGSRFEPGDDTAPLYPISDLPRLPDIEKERDKWDIVGATLAPGDMMVFHMGCLHAGGGTAPGATRRSLSLRFFGDDVVWVERYDEPHPNSSVARRAKAAAAGKRVRGASASSSWSGAKRPPGEPIWRANKFMQVRPWTPW
ncbi:MAG: phytanoyl-CoA dioxygenase family protein [Gammaproteobacteria bacterium]|nr:phytanoyl-CoA dioxygenase family protein [Gammaproteobacteria bacterium]